MQYTLEKPVDIKIINTLNYVFATSLLLYTLVTYWTVSEASLALQVWVLKLRPAVFWFLFYTIMSCYYSWYQLEKTNLEQDSNLKDLYKQNKYQQQWLSFILCAVLLILMFII